MSTVLTKDQALFNIAANITATLDRKGLTQGDVARAIQEEGEELQAARMRVSRYATGKAMPDAVALARIAEALGVTTDFLLSTPPKRRGRRAG
ncbi:MAG: helix-turn-helix domain-containing protein [Pirellulales bacterium]|nr:helix-turn-helix domain-containing protein [Pirellulales bacterium]